MSENTHLLDLLKSRPNAFILLSYLNFLAARESNNSFEFHIDAIRSIGERAALTKDQVRRNLQILQEREFILVIQVEVPRKFRQVTILDRGFIDV